MNFTVWLVLHLSSFQRRHELAKGGRRSIARRRWLQSRTPRALPAALRHSSQLEHHLRASTVHVEHHTR